jgi:hypothetical protein
MMRGLTSAQWIERLLAAGPGVSIVRNNARRAGFYRDDRPGVVIIERRPAPVRVSKGKLPW